MCLYIVLSSTLKRASVRSCRLYSLISSSSFCVICTVRGLPVFCSQIYIFVLSKDFGKLRTSEILSPVCAMISHIILSRLTNLFFIASISSRVILRVRICITSHLCPSFFATELPRAASREPGDPHTETKRTRKRKRGERRSGHPRTGAESRTSGTGDGISKRGGGGPLRGKKTGKGKGARGSFFLFQLLQ